MAVSLKHKFASAVADISPNPDGLILPSNWNDEHDLLIDTSKIVGRTTAGTGSAEEIAVSSDLTLTAGTLGVASSIGGKTLTGPTVVDVNSASTALRITQIGAGNALVVEDSANPDATPFVIDASGNVLIGSTTQNTSFFPTFQLVGNGAPAHTLVQRSQTSVNPVVEYKLKSNGTATAPTIVASGDGVLRLDARAYDGAAYLSTASIDVSVDGTPGTNDMPGRLTFSTTADGASTPTERMRIDSAGNVGIGTTAPGSALDVKGTIRLSGSSSGYVGLAPAAAAGSTTYTLPAADGTSGQLLSTNGSGVLSWGTLTDPSIIGTVVEDIFTITDGASVDIDPSDGSVQLWTLTASRTPVAPTSWTAGQGITLQIDDGTAYAITWTTMGVVWAGGTAPTLATSGYTVVELWKVGTTIYGALVGDVA